MAAMVGRLLSANSNSILRRNNGEKKNLGGRGNVTVMASVAFSGMKEYETLRLSPGATEKDLERSYHHLALQYHPDVCKGNDCGVQFNKINHAYETLISSLEKTKHQNSSVDYHVEDLMGVGEDSWEEWMGWEGAGTLDYSSHINIYA